MSDHDGVVAVVNVSRSWPDVKAGVRTARDVILGDWNPFKGNRPPLMAFDPGTVRLLGRDLWHDLVRVLRPQVMLISVAREHLAQIRFKSDDGWAELCQVEHKKPYIVKYKRVSLNDGTPMLAVFGTAAHTPFGTVSQEDKLRIGGLVRDLIDD
jgi:hypothetical protein